MLVQSALHVLFVLIFLLFVINLHISTLHSVLLSHFHAFHQFHCIVEYTTDTYKLFRMVDLRFYTFAPTFKVTLTIFLYTHDYVHVAEKSLYCLAIHQG